VFEKVGEALSCCCCCRRRRRCCCCSDLGNHNDNFLVTEYNPLQPSCKKVSSPQEGHCEQRCEIQVASQEIILMVG